MASAAEKRYYAPEEYLSLERTAPYKSEYFRGELFAMSGVSREHNLITGNVYRAISSQLQDRPCEVFIADMRVKVSPTGLYTYPDVAVACEEPRFEDDEVDTLLNPTLIVEVLSPSTERYDRGKKFAHYQRVESLKEYVLVSQDAVLVERFLRQDEGWLLTVYRRRDDLLPLESVGVEVSLRAVYARVDVPEGEEGLGHGPPSEPAPLNPR
jgi:Uma2 family endonuclease